MVTAFGIFYKLSTHMCHGIRGKMQVTFMFNTCAVYLNIKGKVLPQDIAVAQGVPGSLRPRIFLTFGTRGVVDRQLFIPAAFTPGEVPVTHF
jgi:hypothetical protein